MRTLSNHHFVEDILARISDGVRRVFSHLRRQKFVFVFVRGTGAAVIVNHPVLKLFEGGTYMRPAKVVQCGFCPVFAREVGKDEKEAEREAVKLGFKLLESKVWCCKTCFENQSRLLPA